jgi:hypothetical protein
VGGYGILLSADTDGWIYGWRDRRKEKCIKRTDGYIYIQINASTEREKTSKLDWEKRKKSEKEIKNEKQ